MLPNLYRISLIEAPTQIVANCRTKRKLEAGGSIGGNTVCGSFLCLLILSIRFLCVFALKTRCVS